MERITFKVTAVKFGWLVYGLSKEGKWPTEAAHPYLDSFFPIFLHSQCFGSEDEFCELNIKSTIPGILIYSVNLLKEKEKLNFCVSTEPL